METVSLILNTLGPLIQREVNLHLNSQEQSEKMASNLKKIQELLDAAEGKQLADPDIKRCFEVLQATAYDMEDALDEWQLMANREADQVFDEMPDRNRVSEMMFWERVRSFTCCLCFLVEQVFQHRRVAGVINDLNDAVDRVYEKAKTELRLVLGPRNFTRDRSTSSIVEAEFPGRKIDKESIKEMLVVSIHDGAGGYGLPFSTVAIIGEGGLGKTTLAQLVYNDSEVGSEFDKRIWVCVSDTFDDIRIAKEILERLDGRKPNVSGFDVLVERIKDSIRGKKFLLVLDDVWIEDHTKWKTIKGCLSSAANGSKILVTTRKEKAASSLGAVDSQMHHLQPLEDEACWSIIRRIALHGKDEIFCRRFESVGRGIAGKCRGSPLAAHILGGHLVTKPTVDDWRTVLESKTWELRNVENNLFPHFFLSYDELEPAVKRCFSYCAVFPKDTEIDVDRLVKIWMALGFLSSGASASEMEREGKAFFNDLAQRSFFQNFEKDEYGEHILKCKMHDIVHDFAQYLSQSECCVLENSDGNYRNARHLYCMDGVNPQADPLSISSIGKLRSFSCSGKLPPNFLIHMKSVRALTLSDCGLECIPEEIGNLVHLRYLDLSGNKMIKEIPEAIFNLYNLQTLVLEGCDGLTGVPEGISKLTNLRHLYASYEREFVIPQGLGRLTNLRTLGYFYAGRGCSNKLGSLRNLNNLSGKLEIHLQDLDDETDVDEAKNAELRRKKSLEILLLEYYENVKIDVIEALEPPPDLQTLLCLGFGAPTWIPSLKNLRRLYIRNEKKGRNLSDIPSFWKMEFLEELHIRWGPLQCLDRDFLGLNDDHIPNGMIIFPALKKLRFVDCEEWTEWEDISEEDARERVNIMPNLAELELKRCWILRELPHRLLRLASSLKRLRIENCNSLRWRYEYGDKDQLSHIPHLEMPYN